MRRWRKGSASSVELHPVHMLRMQSSAACHQTDSRKTEREPEMPTLNARGTNLK